MKACLPARTPLRLSVLSVILIFTLPSCKEEKPENLQPDYRNDIVSTSNALSTAWLKNQFETFPEDNICLSSYPLVMLGSALAAGADGDTARQLWQFSAQSLFKNNAPPANFNASSYLYQIRQLNDQFAKTLPDCYLYNGLYVDKKVELLPQYKKRIGKNLDMDIVSVDFSQNPMETVDGINRKISERTHGLVKNALPSSMINEDIPYLLFNVLAFEGKWNIPFDPEVTKQDTFHTRDAKEVKIPFMFCATRNFRETDKYTLIWLDYAQSTARFVIVLPSQRDGLPQIIRKLNKESLQEYLTMMNSPQKKFKSHAAGSRDLYLPQFKFQTEFRDCIPFMQKEGVKNCFLPGKADFSQMMKTNYSLENILQKCFLQIDEKGTKAYAVTIVQPRGLDTPQVRKKLKIDHPFLCFIMDTKTNMVLFAAAVNDPTRPTGRGFGAMP